MTFNELKNTKGRSEARLLKGCSGSVAIASVWNSPHTPVSATHDPELMCCGLLCVPCGPSFLPVQVWPLGSHPAAPVGPCSNRPWQSAFPTSVPATAAVFRTILLRPWNLLLQYLLKTDFACLCAKVNNYLQMLVFEEGDRFCFLIKKPNHTTVVSFLIATSACSDEIY